MAKLFDALPENTRVILLGDRDQLASVEAGAVLADIADAATASSSPLQNALSRFYERQCDHYALERTRNKEAYRSAFIKLARINKADPDPHPAVAVLFYDHPPIRERLAMAEEVLP